MRLPKLSLMGGALLIGCASFLPSAATAATYQLPIKNGVSVLKIFVDGGNVKRVGRSDQVYLFEVEMPDGQCSSEVRVAFTNSAPTIKVPYNVCSEAGFGLISTRVRR